MSKRSILMLATGIAGAAWIAVVLLWPASGTEYSPSKAHESDITERPDFRGSSSPTTTGEVQVEHSVDEGRATTGKLGSTIAAAPVEANVPAESKGSVEPFQQTMPLGSSHCSLRHPPSLEWFIRYLSSVGTVESMQGGEALTPEMIEAIRERRNVKHIAFGPGLHAMPNASRHLLRQLEGVESVEVATTRPFASNSGPVEDEFNEYVGALLAMPDLASLSLVGTVNDELLRMISEKSKLRTLRLCNNNDLRRFDRITTVGLLHLGRLSGLIELVMIDFTVGRHQIDLAQLASLLSGFSALERLSLSGWFIKDEHLASSAALLSRLKYLNLNGTLITNEFLSLIDSTWQLEELSVLGVALTSEGYAALAPASRLRRLCAGQSLTDDALVGLLSAGILLEHLDASGSMLTDSGLAHLEQCATIRGIALRGCKGVSRLGVLSLLLGSRIQQADLSLCKCVDRSLIDELSTSAPNMKELSVYGCPGLSKSDRSELSSRQGDLVIHLSPIVDQWSR